MVTTVKLKKRLSWNDCGLGRGHQSGVLIPKESGRLLFGGDLKHIRNPKLTIHLSPYGVGSPLPAIVTYYNSSHFGGTRNEYRMTRIAAFLKSVEAQEGDNVVLEIDVNSLRGNIDLERGGSSN